MDEKVSNISLTKAKTNKNDEFYTQLCDIEKELELYKEDFKNKVILCNCDEPNVSNFFYYFFNNFERLGIKKLITTCYKNNIEEIAVYSEYVGEENIEIKRLKGNGDFRSEECIEFLKESDIIITNPPFSLFREYVSQLIEYNKKFILIGNINALTYKDIFTLVKEDKIWLGHSIHNGDREFRVPEYTELKGNNHRTDVDGNKYVEVKGVRWFTNVNYKNRDEKCLILHKKYNPEEYSTYDNYDAINVDKIKDIPIDYYGIIGVPISFIDKYNPEQFEIIKFRKGDNGKDLSINGRYPYFRVLIRKK